MTISFSAFFSVLAASLSPGGTRRHRGTPGGTGGHLRALRAPGNTGEHRGAAHRARDFAVLPSGGHRGSRGGTGGHLTAPGGTGRQQRGLYFHAFQIFNPTEGRSQGVTRSYKESKRVTRSHKERKRVTRSQRERQILTATLFSIKFRVRASHFPLFFRF